MGLKTPSFMHLNQLISDNLTNILTPSHVTQAQPFYTPQTQEEDANRTPSGGGAGKRKKFVPPPDSLLLGSMPTMAWSEPLLHLFSHPSYKLSSLTAIPQLPSSAKTFHTASWPYLIKHIGQMGVVGSSLEDQLDFSIGSIGKKMTVGEVNKRKWHRHFTATAAAVSLFDVGSSFAASSPSMPSVPSSGGGVSSSATSAAASADPPAWPSPSAIPLDAPMPQPVYKPAFADGESYLEYRLNNSTRARPNINSSIASILYLRGLGVCGADATSFLDPSLYATGSLNPLLVGRDPHSLHGDDRSATLWSNSSSVVGPIDQLLDRVYTMLDANAYVHHYEKYGIDREWFAAQAISIEQIAADYQAIK